MSSHSLAASRLERGCPVGSWLLAAGSTVCAAPEARTASVGSTVSIELQDVRGQIPKGHSDMYDEGRVLREKMRRNHSSNRAEISVIALAGGKAFRTTCGQACSRRRGFVASSRAYSRRTGASAPSTSPRLRPVPRSFLAKMIRPALVLCECDVRVHTDSRELPGSETKVCPL